jgi:hypothetical protein
MAPRLPLLAESGHPVDVITPSDERNAAIRSLGSSLVDEYGLR